jgi:hypothetical protein
MVKLTTKIVTSTDLWSKINLCTKSLILEKAKICWLKVYLLDSSIEFLKIAPHICYLIICKAQGKNVSNFI